MIECLVRYKAKTLGIGQIDLQEDMQGTGLTDLFLASQLSFFIYYSYNFRGLKLNCFSLPEVVQIHRIN